MMRVIWSTLSDFITSGQGKPDESELNELSNEHY